MPKQHEIILSPGDVLYREGDANDTAYVVGSGQILLQRIVQGETVEVEVRGPGSILGELSILTDRPRSVTAKAQTKCKLFPLTGIEIAERFKRLDPVLKACVDTSIQFTATLGQATDGTLNAAREAPITLENSQKVIEDLQLRSDMANGLERGDFHMVYQPIVDLSDEKVHGFEALMRWQHPSLGSVPPDHFIRVAEDMQFVTELTKLALTEACGMLKNLRNSGKATDTLYMSVNISGLDIGSETFVDFLTHVLDRNELKPSDIRLEVTETSLVPKSALAEKNLARLHALGIGISVDDFGTGYSNLGYLKHIPLTALKIDRAFAGDVDTNSVSRSIVRVLVMLGQELGVDIVAEGLETQDCVDTLRDLGCRLAQGYFLHKPMAPDMALELIAGPPAASATA